MVLKQKKFIVSVVAMLMVSIWSLGQVSAVYAIESIDDDVNITISQGDYTVDKNKANYYNLNIQTSIGEAYNFDIGVFKWGDIVYEVEDKTGNLSGFFQPLWGQFKEENGLSKYVGKTFDEIKTMKEPEPMDTMAGPMDTPILVHKEILKKIAEIEAERQGKNLAEKNELATAYLKYSPIYENRNNGDYSQQTMDNFSKAQEKAEEILKTDLPEKANIDQALAELKKAKKELAMPEVDYTAIKDQIAKAEEIIAHQEEYDIFTLSKLKENIKVANDAVKNGIQKQSQLNDLTEKLKQSMDDLVKKTEQGKIFTINGTTGGMADDFMNPIITLEEKNGKAIYTIGFRESNKKGLKSKMKHLKHIQNNQEIQAQELEGVGEYKQLFKITRDTLDETELPIIVHPVVMGNDISVKIKLQKDSKKPQYNMDNNVDYIELEKLIIAEQETFDDVNAGVYKPIGSAEYLKKYNKALSILQEKTATQDEVEKAIKDLENSKSLDLSLKAIEDFGQELEKAEAELKLTDKYNADSLENLKKAVDPANKQWLERNNFTKKTLEQARKDLKDAVDALKKKEDQSGNSTVQPDDRKEKHTVSKHDFFTNLSWGEHPSPTLFIMMNKYDNEGEGDNIVFTQKNSDELFEFGKIQVNDGKVYTFKEAGIELNGEYRRFKTLNTDFIKTFYRERKLNFKIFEKDNVEIEFTVVNKLTDEEIQKFSELVEPIITEQVTFVKEYVADVTLEKGQKIVKQEGKNGKKENGKIVEQPVNEIIYVGVKPTETTQEIDFKVLKQPNVNRFEDEQQIVKVEGSKGIKTITTTYKLDKNNEVVLDKVSEKIIKPAVDEIVECGTKKRTLIQNNATAQSVQNNPKKPSTQNGATAVKAKISPNTGDRTPLALYVFIFLIDAAVLTAIIRRKKA